MGLVVGIDTGGTFTDMVVFDPATGRDRSLKTSSTPLPRARRSSTPSTRAASRRPSSSTFTHGTTVGTNALIERTGCKVAFVTTKGFEDTPFIQRINRKVLYDLRWTSRSRSCSRRASSACDERLDSDGAVRRSRVDDERGRGELARRAATPGRRGRRVSLLFSYVSTRSTRSASGDPRGGAAGRAGLRLVRGGADLARVRALVDDDRRRVPAAAVRPLRRRASTRALRRAGMTRAVDDDEVERRRDALRPRRRKRRSRP